MGWRTRRSPTAGRGESKPLRHGNLAPPTVVAAYLDRIGFLSFARALSYLEDLRPVMAPSKALVESIERELTN